MATQVELDELVAVSDGLLDGWRRHGQRGAMPVVEGMRQTQFAFVSGLSAHAHRLADIALDLLTDSKEAEAMPLVRGVYEFAITAHWAALTPDGAEALVNETFRQRTYTAKLMSLSAVDVLREGAGKIAGANSSPLPSSSAQSGKRFEERCNDLTPGGIEANLYYRLMSEHVHPGVVAIDQYLAETGEPPIGVRLRIDPKPASSDERATWVFFIASALVWAGRAVDYFDKAHMRQDELRLAAERLRIESDLHLSPAAEKRLSDAEPPP